MNGDLERDLAREGDLAAFAASLQRAPAAQVPADFTARVMAAVHDARRAQSHRWLFALTAGLPMAAGIALCLLFGSTFFRAQPAYSTVRLVSCQRADGLFSASSAATYMQAFAVTALAQDPKAPAAALGSAVAAIVREQNAEGGWANAELSARNVVALEAAAAAGVSDAARAYKRGLRYLRTHGIGELTRSDIARAAQAALVRVDRADRGLACSAALCAAL